MKKNQKDLRVALKVYERKVRRRIYGGKKVDLFKKKLELVEQYGEPSRIGIARIQRIRWLGYVGRMENERTAPLVSTRRISGKRTKEKS